MSAWRQDLRINFVWPNEFYISLPMYSDCPTSGINAVQYKSKIDYYIHLMDKIILLILIIQLIRLNKGN